MILLHILKEDLRVYWLPTFYIVLAIKGIDFSYKNNADIYWFYYPLKTTYFYFIAGVIVTTYIGEFLKFLKRIFKLKSDKQPWSVFYNILAL